MAALGRLAPVEWRDWHAASGPGRGDSAFENFSWRSSKRHLRFRFANNGRDSEQGGRLLKPHQSGEGSTCRDPWAGYEPHRAVRGALGLRLKGQCTLDDELAAMTAAIAAGAAATRCATRTYSWEDDDRDCQGAKLVDVFDALLVEICQALHAEARGSALERIGGPATTSAALISPLDTVSPAKKVGGLSLLARRGSTLVATDESVNEVAASLKLADSAGPGDDASRQAVVAPPSTSRALLKPTSAATLGGFAKSTLFLGATMGTGSTSGKIQRGRRCKQLADLALLATCADDALARAAEAYVELRADALHWQAGALVTWCAAAVAVVGDAQAFSTVAATMPLPPLLIVDLDVDGNGVPGEDSVSDERRQRAVDDSRTYARRCVEAAASEAADALDKLGAKGSPLLAEILLKVAKWRTPDPPATFIARAMTRTLDAVEDACLGAVETARIALAAAVICARAGAARKAAVLAASAARNCTELHNWAGAVVAWRLTDRCTTDGWTMVRRRACAGATAAADHAGDATEHARGLAYGLEFLAGLCRAVRVPDPDYVPSVTVLMPLAGTHIDTMAGADALLARWFNTSLYEAEPRLIPPYVHAFVPRSHRGHGSMEFGTDLWHKSSVERMSTTGESTSLSGASVASTLCSSDGSSQVKSAFFFDPFSKKRAATRAAKCDDVPSGWVVGERCTTSVTFRNPLSVPIFIQDVSLVIKGACCACHPTRNLALVKDDKPVHLDLQATPLEPTDELKIVGVVARLALAVSTPRRSSRRVFLAFAPDAIQRRIWPPFRNEAGNRYGNSMHTLIRADVAPTAIVTVLPPQPRFDASFVAVAAKCATLNELSMISRPGEKISLTLRLENQTHVSPVHFEVAASKMGTTRRQILFDASDDDHSTDLIRRGRHFYEIFDPLDVTSKVKLRGSLADNVITLNLRLAHDLAGSALIGELIVSYAATDLACRRASLPFVFEPAQSVRILSCFLRRPTRLVHRGDRVETANESRRCLIMVIANDADIPISVRIVSKSRWVLIAANTPETVLFCESTADIRSSSLEWRVRGSREGRFDGEGILTFAVDPVPTVDLQSLQLALRCIKSDHLSLTLRAMVSNVTSEVRILPLLNFRV